MTDEEKLKAEAEAKAKKEAEDTGKPKPTEYEIELRKENEKLRKKLEAKAEEERKAKEEEMKQKEDFRSLAEAKTKESDELRVYKEKWEAFEKSERERLIAELPEDKRDKFATADITILRETVELIKSQKKPAEPPPSSKSGEVELNTAPKTLRELMKQDQTYIQKFMEKFPEQYAKLRSAAGFR